MAIPIPIPMTSTVAMTVTVTITITSATTGTITIITTTPVTVTSTISLVQLLLVLLRREKLRKITALNRGKFFCFAERTLQNPKPCTGVLWKKGHGAQGCMGSMRGFCVLLMGVSKRLL